MGGLRVTLAMWFANNPTGLGCGTFIAMVQASEFGDFDDRATLHNLTLDRSDRNQPRSSVGSYFTSYARLQS